MPDVANVGPSAQSIPVINSEWPPDVLYVHLSGRIEDLKAHLGDLRTSDLLALQAAFAAAEKGVDTALLAAEKAVNAALASQEKAVVAALNAAEKATDKYEREVKEWRVASNEWRDAMKDREALFVQVETFDARARGMTDQFQARLNGIDHQLAALDSKIDDLTRSRDLAAGRAAAQVIGIGLIFSVITIVLRFL